MCPTRTRECAAVKIFNFQGGVDLALTGGIAVGPFVSFSLAQYSNATRSGSGASATCGGEIDSTTHEWITFGVRGVVVP